MLGKPEVKKAMDARFVTVVLDVMESGEKKALENPGGQAVMEANGGKGAGLPFLYFSDANGKLIVNSIRPAGWTPPGTPGQGGSGRPPAPDKGGNIGCPYEPIEIAWFMEMIAKASPGMPATDRTTIRTAFEALKKAGG